MTKTVPSSNPPLDGASLSDPAPPVRLVHQMTKVDRIDNRGNIREHLTRDGRRTICGIAIGQRQLPCGNATCGRCEKIAARCQIEPRASSGEQEPMTTATMFTERHAS